MKIEYTTGDFARLCNITKKTLFHYDKIDLLKPTRVDENGYRYYTLYQFDVVSAIKLYQTIGLSLKEIAALFRDQETADKEEILTNQKQAIQEKITELQRIYAGIEFMSERFAVFKAKGPNVLFHEQLVKDEYYQVLPRQALPSDSYNFLHYGYQYGLLFENWTDVEKEAVTKATNFFSAS
ncbi:MerR family DNA-binding transcriptional regulator [Listeria grayi]|uniref:Transcriptional regulator n=1 Tax=Listeria grayi FSL F6-1183 TaxID=1265827 RepID=A0A829R405_LISGR|nr:MerR family DNA-binding transcriptional regulator [Listeria grayi]EUJ25799.1 transcriptional regulator [Listeria grayi FSL F6-1183]